jgi:hypothetical protein
MIETIASFSQVKDLGYDDTYQLAAIFERIAAGNTTKADIAACSKL